MALWPDFRHHSHPTHLTTSTDFSGLYWNRYECRAISKHIAMAKYSYSTTGEKKDNDWAAGWSMLSFSAGETVKEGRWRLSSLLGNSTEARADKLGEPCPRHVPQSRIFIAIHTEALPLLPQSPAVSGGVGGENRSSPQLTALHGGNCPRLVWEVLRQDFGSGQVLDECNFLVECLTHNWILANAFAGDGVHVAATEIHEE